MKCFLYSILFANLFFGNQIWAANTPRHGSEAHSGNAGVDITSPQPPVPFSSPASVDNKSNATLSPASKNEQNANSNASPSSAQNEQNSNSLSPAPSKPDEGSVNNKSFQGIDLSMEPKLVSELFGLELMCTDDGKLIAKFCGVIQDNGTVQENLFALFVLYVCKPRDSAGSQENEIVTLGNKGMSGSSAPIVTSTASPTPANNNNNVNATNSISKTEDGNNTKGSTSDNDEILSTPMSASPSPIRVVTSTPANNNNNVNATANSASGTVDNKDNTTSPSPAANNKDSLPSNTAVGDEASPSSIDSEDVSEVNEKQIVENTKKAIKATLANLTRNLFKPKFGEGNNEVRMLVYAIQIYSNDALTRTISVNGDSGNGELSKDLLKWLSRKKDKNSNKLSDLLNGKVLYLIPNGKESKKIKDASGDYVKLYYTEQISNNAFRIFKTSFEKFETFDDMKGHIPSFLREPADKLDANIKANATASSAATVVSSAAATNSIAAAS